MASSKSIISFGMVAIPISQERYLLIGSETAEEQQA